MYSTAHICQDIAHKLKDPESVRSHIEHAIQCQNFSQDRWLANSLSEGIPGIALFFSVMDSHYPNEGWDKVAHNWLQHAFTLLEQEGYSNISLFTGLTGITFATYVAARDNYQLLEDLETRLIEELDHSWTIPLRKATTLTPNYYNLMQGISGVIAYLLLRKDDPRMKRALLGCVEELSSALIRTFPAWHADGHHILTMPYGITGPLSALSLALRDGIETNSLRQAIELLSGWLKTMHNNLQWPATVPADSVQPIEIGLNKDLWAFGAPSVARSLYLAADALHDESLKAFSEEAFMAVFTRSETDWNQMASTFAMGKAGMLALTYFMLKECKTGALKEKLSFFEERIKSFYSPYHHFGFRLVDVTENGQYRWVDNPGLLEGAVGVALSLLLLENERSSQWERALLLN